MLADARKGIAEQKQFHDWLLNDNNKKDDGFSPINSAPPVFLEQQPPMPSFPILAEPSNNVADGDHKFREFLLQRWMDQFDCLFSIIPILFIQESTNFH
jgi:hypothetical protein